jgi:hypothetical protein
MEIQKTQTPSTSTRDKNIRQFILLGVITFMYCVIPVIQFHLFGNISDRFNDHYIFVFSMKPFEFMELVYTNSIIPYLIQLLVWLFYWVIFYNFFEVLKKARKKETN